jgi:pimeloyl-ACP methyl ester carboxylesterase
VLKLEGCLEADAAAGINGVQRCFEKRICATSIIVRSQKTGFTGGLNWYRNIDRNWELLSPFAGSKIIVPALFIYGDRDIVARFPGMHQTIADLSSHAVNLQGSLRLTDCGHWTQQESPAEVNTALIEFLRAL